VRGIDSGDVHAALDKVAGDARVGRRFLGQRDHDPGPPLRSFRAKERGRSLLEEPHLGLTKSANSGEPREGCGVAEECAEGCIDGSDARTDVGLRATQ
jgi:hypothetical protein